MLQYLVYQVVYRCFTLEISCEIKTLEGEGVVRKKKKSKKPQNASMTLL